MNTLNLVSEDQYYQAIFIVIASFFAVFIMRLVIRLYAMKVSGKTKTDIDDIMIGAIRTPLSILILTSGAFLALQFMPNYGVYSLWADRLFFVICVFLVSIILSRLADVLIGRWLNSGKRHGKTPRVINKVVYIVIYTISLLTILLHFGVEIGPLIAALGLGGLAIGLALKDTLSNFFAGLHIVSDKPITIGDFIELPEEKLSGTVKDIGWRSTRIKTLDGNIVVAPNMKLSESIIVNSSQAQKKVKLFVDCGVAYGSDLVHVEKVTVSVIKEMRNKMEEIDDHEEPVMRFHTFGDSNIEFRAIIMVKEYTDRFLVRHEFIKTLKARFDKEGIEISWPERKVHMMKD